MPFDVRVSIVLLATLGTVLFLRLAGSVLIPMVLAAMIAYLCGPMVEWLHRIRVPRFIGSAITLLLFFGAIGWTAYAMRNQARDVVERVPVALMRLRGAVETGTDGTVWGRIERSVTELQKTVSAGGAHENQPSEGTNADDAAAAGSAANGARGSAANGASGSAANGARIGAANSGSGSASSRSTGTTGRAAPPATSAPQTALPVTSLLWTGAQTLSSAIGALISIVFLAYFFLLAAPAYRDCLLQLQGSSRKNRHITREVLDETTRQVRRFIVVRAATAILVGLATWGALAWYGLREAAFWGALAGLFNSVPYFGPIIVSSGLAVVALTQFGTPSAAAEVALIALAITSLEGFVITPPLLGKAANMSALAVFVSMILWTWIWGPWGTILAVPVMVMIKAISDHVEPLRPISRLLEG
jgi:predicted PurR-regulated permease PerM